MLSYSKKQLKIIITLAKETFRSTGTNTIILDRFRASVDIEKAGGTQFSTAVCKIYGVSQDDMNDITTVMWTRNLLNQNTIEIYAIDDTNNYQTMVFAGDIIQALGYYQEMPNVYLAINAQGSFYNALKPYPPTSYQGSVDVATAISKIATSLGYHFENNGVNARINNLYAWNTGIEQIKAIAAAAGIDIYFDDKTIAICPAGKPRTNYVVTVSRTSGMITYPTIDGIGINLYTLFDPLITFGGRVQVESDVTRANAEWLISSLSHYLESETPDGAWFTFIRGSYHGFAITK